MKHDDDDLIPWAGDLPPRFHPTSLWDRDVMTLQNF